MSSVVNNSTMNATPRAEPNNVPPFTMHFQTVNTPFLHLSTTILPRVNASTIRAYITYRFRNTPVVSRLMATRLIFHTPISPTSTQTSPPPPTSPTPESPTTPAQPLCVTVAACKGHDNSFMIMGPPLTPHEGDPIQDGSHLLLNDKMHVQIVGYHELFLNVVIFAGQEEYTGRIIELWTSRDWAVVSERARMGLLMDTSTLHSRIPNIYEDHDPFSPSFNRV